MTSGMREHIRAPGAKHWSNSDAGARRQDSQAPRSRAAEQANQERLGAIVGVVGGRDPVGSRFDPSSVQRCVPCVPCARLEISAIPELQATACEFHAQLAGEALREVELGAGFMSQTMVDAVGEQRERVLLG
jgi:hypothetical protein